MFIKTKETRTSAYELGLTLTKAQKEKVVVSSINIAKNFEKRHADVLRAIETIECSSDFRELNFVFTLKTVAMPNNATRQDPEYLITRDGFAFLAMGFTGARAAKFKEAYITAFNEMERRINGFHAQPKKYERSGDFVLEERVSGIYYAVPIVHDFIMDCCEKVPNFHVSRTEFYRHFTWYCAERATPTPTRCSAVRALNELAYFREYRSSGTRYWKGLRILRRHREWLCDDLPV